MSQNMTEERGGTEVESAVDATVFQIFPYDGKYNQIAIVFWI